MLLMRNFMRVAAINMVTPAIMFFGKLFICLTTFAIVYLASINAAAQVPSYLISYLYPYRYWLA